MGKKSYPYRIGILSNTSEENDELNPDDAFFKYNEYELLSENILNFYT